VTGRVLLAAALLAPLAVDTFLLATALGLAGLPRRLQLRTSLVLASFEAVMPIVGVVVGRGVGTVVGDLAAYAAALVIVGAGVVLLRADAEEDRERERLRLLARAKGTAVLGLGLGISLDELAIGFGLGLLEVSLPLVVIFLGVQAFAASQLGLRLGGRLGEGLRDGAERLAASLLIGVGLCLIVLELVGHGV
jgi:putative Mn2+ efflux pump MntP